MMTHTMDGRESQMKSIINYEPKGKKIIRKLKRDTFVETSQQSQGSDIVTYSLTSKSVEAKERGDKNQ
jgi:hypothetical protein